MPEVRRLLQVYDELVFEVPQAQVADLQALMKATMERAAAMSVLLVVEVAGALKHAHRVYLGRHSNVAATKGTRCAKPSRQGYKTCDDWKMPEPPQSS